MNARNTPRIATKRVVRDVHAASANERAKTTYERGTTSKRGVRRGKSEARRKREATADYADDADSGGSYSGVNQRLVTSDQRLLRQPRIGTNEARSLAASQWSLVTGP